MSGWTIVFNVACGVGLIAAALAKRHHDRMGMLVFAIIMELLAIDTLLSILVSK